MNIFIKGFSRIQVQIAQGYVANADKFAIHDISNCRHLQIVKGYPSSSCREICVQKEIQTNCLRIGFMSVSGGRHMLVFKIQSIFRYVVGLRVDIDGGLRVYRRLNIPVAIVFVQRIRNAAHGNDVGREYMLVDIHRRVDFGGGRNRCHH